VDAPAQATACPAPDDTLQRYQALVRQAEALLDQRDSALAGAACSAAIHLMPDAAPAFRLLGQVLLCMHLPAQAEVTLREAVRLDPGDLAARQRLAQALGALARWDEAEAVCRALLAIAPGHVPAWQGLAALCARAGRTEEEEQARRTVATLLPGSVDTHIDLGALLSKRGRHGEAGRAYLAALAIEPGHATALRNLGCALMAQGRVGEAVQRFQQAIFIRPRHPEAWCNLAGALLRLDLPAQAETSCREALHLSADYPSAWNNLGSIHKARGDGAQAEACYRKAIGLAPDLAEAHSNLGIVLYERGAYGQAEACYRQALHCNPAFGGARFNLALLLLLHGRFDDGWPLYEARWDTFPLCVQKRVFVQPLWLGDQPLAGKTILLHAEQGLGDTIQFVRYASVVKQLGATVIVQVAPALLQLLRGADGIDACVPDWPTDCQPDCAADGGRLPRFDYHCPLLSLPLALKTGASAAVPCAPYLRADRHKAARFEQRLGPRRTPRVGLVWQGSRKHQNDHLRSMPLALLLACLPRRFTYVALQNDLSADDADTLAGHPHVHSFTEDLHDFSDTAALTDRMDLVLSVDTSVAHLAGALGVRTWIMLPRVPDWRWMLERDDTPWYPDLTLFRQQGGDAWERVAGRVARALNQAFQAGVAD